MWRMLNLAQAIAALSARLEGDPAFFEPCRHSFALEIDGPHGGTWTARAGSCWTLLPGAHECEVALKLSEDTFLALVQDELNPQTAFQQGLIRVRGKAEYALPLQRIFEPCIYARDLC